MEQTEKSDSTATSKNSNNNENSSTSKSFTQRWFKTVNQLKSQLQFEAEYPDQTPKNPEFSTNHTLIRHQEADVKVTPMINLAGLNTKDDSYMITPDGTHLIFLTFNEIIKYSLKEMKIVERSTLAPLIFPFLKKMTVRKRSLLISSCGNKILGIICQDAFKGFWYFLIYDVHKKVTERKYLGGGGTRGKNGTGLKDRRFKTKNINLKVSPTHKKERVGEKIKEWIIADGWKNYIFYKVEKSKFQCS